MNKSKLSLFIACITIFLFLLPFFWFHPGEVDLGGDSSRLYFYDPINYLRNYALTGVSPSSYGAEDIGYYIAPFVLSLAVLKLFFSSPTILIAGFHGLNFSLAFISVYFIVKELLIEKEQKNKYFGFAALISGLYYVFSQTSIQGWDKVLITHNQFFLNPLVFLLLLKYFKTDKVIYLVGVLLITFPFAPNFSFVAAPGFFAFYPLSILFLVLYRLFIVKKKIFIKHFLLFFAALILLQSIHIIPQLISMFTAGSVLNTTVFSSAGKIDRGLGYFTGIAPLVNTSKSIMNLPQLTPLSWVANLFIIFPVIIVTGFLFCKSKTLLLIGLFFLITFLFETANVTHLWLKIYEEMFNLPGFSIFRNFFGQWSYSYLFYYTLLVGVAFANILQRITPLFRYIFSFVLASLLLFSALPFVTGAKVNPAIWQSNNIHIISTIDPNFEKAIAYLRDLPPDGKVLSLPMTDPGYQIIVGPNGGAYQGPSTVSYLTGKKDFAGSLELGIYQQPFLDAVAQKDYKKINDILTTIGIRYIFYNSDARAYETGFPSFPYADARKFLPKNQKEYKDFLAKLNLKKLKQYGYYTIYEREKDQILPVIFTSKNNIYANFNQVQDIDPNLNSEIRSVNFDKDGLVGNAVTKIYLSLDTTTDFSRYVQQKQEPLSPYAFTTHKLNSPFYPIAIRKEKMDLESYKSINDEYIDKAIFYADKRLNELARWGDETPILGNITSISELDKKWKEPSVFDIADYKEYNSWEVSLLRYKRQMSDLIKKVKYGNLSSNYPEITNKKYIKDFLDKHQQELTYGILHVVQSPKQQIYLFRLANALFDSLRKEDNIVLPDPKRLTYSVEVPHDGIYSVYFNNKDMSDISSWAFLFDNRLLPGSSNNSEQNAWQHLSNTYMKANQKHTVTLKISDYTNLFGQQENDKTGVIYPVAVPQAGGIYMLSFQYDTHGKYYFTKIFENETDSTKPIQSYDTKLNSSGWKQFSDVIQVSSTTQSGYVKIGKLHTYVANLLAPEGESKQNTIDIKNLAFIRIPTPEITLTSNIKNNVLDSPNISFKKINSSKYILHISDVTSPFTLVFQNAFNNRWKIFPTEKNITGTLADSYFNKQIIEMAPENVLFDPQPFETLGITPVATDRHFSVNGYANAWVITSQDLHGKKDGTFIIEMTTQRYFYVGFIISVVTFCVVLFYFLYLLIRYAKK